VSKGSHE